MGERTHSRPRPPPAPNATAAGWVSSTTWARGGRSATSVSSASPSSACSVSAIPSASNAGPRLAVDAGTRTAVMSPVPPRRLDGRPPRREAEPEAGFLDAAPHAAGRQLDHQAERLQHIGGAALRGRTAGPVLAHRDAGAGGDERGHRRDVDRVGAVATRTDDVDGAIPQVVAEGDELGVAQDGVEQPGQLLGRLALRPQGDDE